MTPAPRLLPIGLKLYRRHFWALLFFSACIAVGVGFLFSVGNLLAAVETGIRSRARELLAADVEISSHLPFSSKAKSLFSALEAEGHRLTPLASFPSMLRRANPADTPFLISVKAVESGYPLYGTLGLDPPESLDTFRRGDGCLVDAEAALQHGISLGERVRVGEAEMPVVGFIRHEPDRTLRGFDLAPRVFMPFAAVEKTGLVRFGSRIRSHMLIALPPQGSTTMAASRLSRRLTRQLDDPYLRINAFHEAQPTLRAAMKRATNFFVLVALVTLLLGVVGMATSVELFLNEQLETAAILRALGLGPGHVAKIYHGLCLAIGLQGGLLGSLGGWLMSRFALGALASGLGFNFEIPFSFDFRSLAESLFLASSVSVGVTFFKVRALAKIPPIEIFRERAERIPSDRKASAVVMVAGGLAVFAYAYWKSESVIMARAFAAGIVGASIALTALTQGSLRLLGALLNARSKNDSQAGFAFRQGMLQLTRERARTRLFLFTLSAGFSLLGALGLVHKSLSREIFLGRAQDVPDLFLIDIQRSQLEGVKEIAARYSETAANFSPLIRARLRSVNGGEIKRRRMRGMNVEQRNRQRLRTREYNLTYKESLNDSERLIAGKFWEGPEAAAQISIEEGFAGRLGVKMGDNLVFDIQGRPIQGRITSVRSIEWMSMLPNFFIVMPPESLRNAPQNFIGSLRVSTEAERAAFQRDLSRGFPNVSVINVSKVLDNVQVVLGALLQALTVVAWFCVIVGLLVLAGTLGLGHKERRRHTALLRALGASRAQIVSADGVELLSIGAFTFVIGSLVAYGLGWFISSRMDIRFAVDFAGVLGSLAAALSLPVAVGLLANARAYGAGVMETLRREV